jgi:hypothetical protein
MKVSHLKIIKYSISVQQQPTFLLPGSGKINSKQGVKNNILIIIWKVEIMSGKCLLTLLSSARQ